MEKSRREFIQAIAASPLIHSCLKPGAVAASDLGIRTQGAKRTVRAAAVQMTIRSGDVDANLDTAERLVLAAIKDGATWITLPEFFTSGYGPGNDPKLLDAHRPVDGEPAALLKELARESGGVVGGSFLAQRDGDTYNTYVLALSDGRVFRHDKDTPSTGDEASNYIGGHDEGLVHFADPPIDVGVALCWEFVRYRTARRLRGKVDVVMGGSAYIDSDEFDDGFRPRNAQILDQMPRKFARLVGAPVVHANPVGRITIGEYSNPQGEYVYDYMGRSQIVSATGRTIVVRDRRQGEGVVVADIDVGRAEALDDLKEEWWIPDVPQFYEQVFNQNRPKGAKVYQQFTRPHRNKGRSTKSTVKSSL